MTVVERLGEGHLAIFLFHGVIERQRHAVRNYTGKHMLAEQFRAVLTSLTAAGGVALSMDQVLAAMQGEAPLPPRAFAITFDDGFANNLTVAAPILAELEIPAAFYVTTGFVEHNGMSWIDRIEACLEEVPDGTLHLPWRDGPVSFRAEDRIPLLGDIRRAVKSDAAIDVEGLIASIYRQCGRTPVTATDDPLDLKLTWDEVRRLDGHPLFTVGGHSHSHAILSFCDEAGLEREIDGSIRLLVERAGIRSPHYSYPEGLAHCYDRRVIDRLKGLGIRCCPTAIDGINLPGADPFELRRIMM
jgi:peptidoglycan/xylan/chitin deacetylase (PgdA/CDA1 family)